jgi:hypothetical protein
VPFQARAFFIFVVVWVEKDGLENFQFFGESNGGIAVCIIWKIPFALLQLLPAGVESV